MLGWSRGRLRVISAGPQPHVFLSTQRGPGAAACWSRLSSREAALELRLGAPSPRNVRGRALASDRQLAAPSSGTSIQTRCKDGALKVWWRVCMGILAFRSWRCPGFTQLCSCLGRRWSPYPFPSFDSK